MTFSLKDSFSSLLIYLEDYADIVLSEKIDNLVVLYKSPFFDPRLVFEIVSSCGHYAFKRSELINALLISRPSSSRNQGK